MAPTTFSWSAGSLLWSPLCSRQPTRGAPTSFCIRQAVHSAGDKGALDCGHHPLVSPGPCHMSSVPVCGGACGWLICVTDCSAAPWADAAPVMLLSVVGRVAAARCCVQCGPSCSAVRTGLCSLGTRKAACLQPGSSVRAVCFKRVLGHEVCEWPVPKAVLGYVCMPPQIRSCLTLRHKAAPRSGRCCCQLLCHC